MKKFNLLAVLVLLLISCQKDDETFVPLYELPQNFSETSLSDTSVRLNWDNVNASSYKIEYGITGFSQGEGNILTTTENSLTLHNLIPATSYDYVFYAIFADQTRSVRRSFQSLAALTAPVRPQFLPKLSQLGLFKGSLKNLAPSPYAFEYDLNTKLFTDYSHKQRVIALPLGTSMTYNGDGLPNFPDNTVIAKTFYYNLNERDLSLGKKIIETRVMIKINGFWEFGDYVWNEDQKDAILDNGGSEIPVEWIDGDGMTQNIEYSIPSSGDCFSCHSSNGNKTLIGPKLRSLNFDVNGINQLQRLKDMQLLTGLTNPTDVGVLPNWEDSSATLEQRARAYLDIQCAHCHTVGGYCEVQSTLRLSYETSLADSKIVERNASISTRINSHIEGFSMPLIGTSIIHTEGVSLVQAYLDTL